MDKMSKSKTAYTAIPPDGKIPFYFVKGGAEIVCVIFSRHTPSALRNVDNGFQYVPYGDYGEWNITSTHKTMAAGHAKLAYHEGLKKHKQCAGWEHELVEVYKS